MSFVGRIRLILELGVLGELGFGLVRDLFLLEEVLQVLQVHDYKRKAKL